MYSKYEYAQCSRAEELVLCFVGLVAATPQRRNAATLRRRRLPFHFCYWFVRCFVRCFVGSFVRCRVRLLLELVGGELVDELLLLVVVSSPLAG